MRRRRAERGITLLELMIVMTIVGLMVGVMYPSIAAGLESMRMRSATDAVAGFLSQAMLRAERSQEPVELVVRPGTGRMELHGALPGFRRELVLPDGVTVLHVLPEFPGDPPEERSILFLPAANVPAVGIELLNRRGLRRIVRIDPLTGSPSVETPVASVSGEER
ncbi:prepilin-type N-terminal cleavage/methylation domain-containing protein [uncultured Paludibaculum sp.]|uniref:pilus assembly FimT family protein n=1 Tax=uncultured Paludibaculum sp. TaxID=1765020 RepID=UPI002AAC07A0|nr:prepilin-type N-terminal cleavage/methylation domain-containing protein [uncultured Paludibaculum sp.]